jgi:hypothetical protein
MRARLPGPLRLDITQTMAKKTSPTPDVAAPASAPVESPSRGRSLQVAERKARQADVLSRTLLGEKAATIAKELGVSTKTITQDIAMARQATTILAAREYLSSVVPKALAVLEAHLENGDKDVALVMLEGLGLLGKNVNLNFNVPTTPGQETFESFRQRVTKAREPEVAAAPAREPFLALLEGEIVK